jgi:probable HAF family extracellular repeat protein
MRLRIALVSSFGMLILLGVSAQAQNPTARYVIRDLGALPGGGFSQPGLMNDAGVVAGLSTASDGIQHAVLWVGDQIVDLNSSGDHGLNAGAFGINALGRVSLQTETSAYDPNDENFCAYGTHRVCAAAVWQGGRIIVLPTLGGNNSTVGNVNSRGQIPGVAETAIADPSCASRVPSQKLRYQAVVWEPGRHRVRALPLPGTDTVSLALWMNDRGQVVGIAGNCSNTNPPPIAGGQHAILWESDGTAVDLGNLGYSQSAALAINNLGQVVGASSLRDDSTFFNGAHAFVWTRQHGMKDLGALAGDLASGAVSINDAGEIVGISFDPAGNPRAVYWSHGRPVDLNTQVASGSNLYLLWAGDINNRGEITGWGIDTSTREIHTYLAVPNRMHDNAIPAVQLDLPSTDPIPLAADVRQRFERGYATHRYH